MPKSLFNNKSTARLTCGEQNDDGPLTVVIIYSHSTTESIFYMPTFSSRLELVDLVLGVTKLGQVTGQITLVLRTLLGSTDSLVQTRWTADKDLYVTVLWARKNSLEQLLGDVALSTRPVLRWSVEGVESTEAVWEFVLEILPLALEQDVFFGQVAEDESHLGLVVWVLEDAACELVHGCDSCAAGDQRDVLVLVRLPSVFWNGALHVEALAGYHLVHVLGHWSAGVFLDDEVEVADSIWEG